MNDNTKAERKMGNARKYANRILGFAFCLYLFIVIILFYRSTNIKEFYWAALWKYNQLNENEPNRFFMANILQGVFHGSEFVNKKYDEIHRPYIELYGFFQKILGKNNLESNSLARLTNNQLTFLLPRISDNDIELYARKSQCLYNELKRENVPFLFVMFPYKVHKVETNLPRGIKDYSNDNADRLLERFEKYGVPYIDTRQLYINDPDRHYQLFYSGDHHWKPEYAYETYKYLSATLQREGLPEAQFFGDEGLEITNMKRTERSYLFSSMPSQVKRIGKYYHNVTENTVFIVPKSRTNFTITCPNINLEETGDINDTLLSYCDFQPIVHIQNTLAPNRNKVVLISDSYSLVFVHFLALQNYQVDYILPWEYKDNLYDYIQTTHPDIVIFALNPLCIKDTVFKIF